MKMDKEKSRKSGCLMFILLATCLFLAIPVVIWSRAWWIYNSYKNVDKTSLGPVTQIAYYRKSPYFATANGDGSASVWSLGDYRELRRFPHIKGSVQHQVAIATNPSVIAITSNRPSAREFGVNIWNIDRGKIQRQVFGHTKPVCIIALAHDGRWMITGSEDRCLRLWNLVEDRSSVTFTRELGDIKALVLSLSEDFALSLENVRDEGEIVDGKFTLWDIRQGISLLTFVGKCGPVSGIALSPDGRFAAAVAKNGKVWLWDTRRGAQRVRKELHSTGEQFTNVAFTAEGNSLLATGGSSRHGVLVEWDLTTGSQKRLAYTEEFCGPMVLTSDRIVAIERFFEISPYPLPPSFLGDYGDETNVGAITIFDYQTFEKVHRIVTGFQK